VSPDLKLELEDFVTFKSFPVTKGAADDFSVDLDLFAGISHSID
jgi:hypothetical protein